MHQAQTPSTTIKHTIFKSSSFFSVNSKAPAASKNSLQGKGKHAQKHDTYTMHAITILINKAPQYAHQAYQAHQAQQ